MRSQYLNKMLIIAMMAGAVAAMTGMAAAEVPGLIQYQGRLTDGGGNPLDTVVDLTFVICDDSLCSNKLWDEDHLGVVVADGLFDVMLGQTTTIGKTVFNGSKRWLGVAIEGGDVLQPMTPIVSSGYSIRSQYADTALYSTNTRHADTAEVALNAGSAVWIDAGNEVYLSTLTDSVGIGTDNPRAPLEVQGPGHAIIGESHGSGTAAGVYGANENDGFGIMGVSNYGRGVTGLSVTGFGGHFYGAKNYFNKNLGIGTESPTEMLHIYNNSSGGSIKIQTDHATNWDEAGLRFATPQNTWHFRMDDDANNNMPAGGLSLRSQNLDAEVMTWAENGRVGIGTKDPNYTLETVSSSTTIRARCTGGGIGVYASSETGFGMYSDADKNFMGGLTGFGQIDPTHRVTVNGAIALQSSGNTKYHFNYYNGGFNISETTVADYRLFIKDGGNVGIGTSNPQAKLHVAGTLHADAFEADAIGRDNIRDEVGVAYTSSSSRIPLTTDWVPYLTKQITIPTSGYILAIGCVTLYLEHGVSGSTRAALAFSDLPDDINGGYEYRVLLFSDFDAGTMTTAIPCQRLFYKSAGTYTFYMLGSRWPDNPASIYEREMALIFLPTPYGSKNGVISLDPGDNITTIAAEDQQRDWILARTSTSNEDADESRTEAYDFDLTQQIESLKAEIEGMKTRLQTLENK